jgi:hypothetical protein
MGDVKDFNPSIYSNVTDMLGELGYKPNIEKSVFENKDHKDIEFNLIIGHTPDTFWNTYKDNLLQTREESLYDNLASIYELASVFATSDMSDIEIKKMIAKNPGVQGYFGIPIPVKTGQTGTLRRHSDYLFSYSFE